MFVNNLNPVAFEFFNLEIRWYSLAYIFGIIFAVIYGKRLITKKNLFNNNPSLLENYITYAIFGIILGGRIGYVLFYDLNYFLEKPYKILFVWEGGMSFHGGMIGIILSVFLFIKKNKIDFLNFTDLIALITPIGLFLGRIANFINSELVGNPTNVAWSVIFIKVDNLPRHPSQLYEAFLEGIFLFIILNFLMIKFLNKRGVISSMFLIFYGFFRILSEFFRQPDIQLGYIFSKISMGSILSFFMIITGLILFFYVKNNNANIKTK